MPANHEKKVKLRHFGPTESFGRTPRELGEEYAKKKIKKLFRRQNWRRNWSIDNNNFHAFANVFKEINKIISQELIISRSSRIYMSRCVTCVWQQTKWNQMRIRLRTQRGSRSAAFRECSANYDTASHCAACPSQCFFPPLQPPDSPIMCA